VLSISENITNLNTIIKSIDFVLQSHISRKKSKPSTFHPLTPLPSYALKQAKHQKKEPFQASSTKKTSFSPRKKGKQVT
jgi:hypothetical protein